MNKEIDFAASTIPKGSQHCETQVARLAEILSASRMLPWARMFILVLCAASFAAQTASSQEKPAAPPALQTAGKPQGTNFREESIDGAPLVGLEVGLFGPSSVKSEAGVFSVRPIWQLKDEREVGPLFGVKGVQTIRLEAPAGALVSSVIAHVENDQVIGLRLVYTKADETTLSRWVGARAKTELTLSGNGQPITALEGSVQNKVTSLGFRFGSKPPEKLVGPGPFVPTADYEAALKEVESWKVETFIDEDAPGRPIKALRMQSRTITPQKLAVIGRLGSLEEIFLVHTFGAIKAEHVAPLAKLTRLQSLDVSHSYWFDDSHLLALRELPNLVNLNVHTTRVTGGGISQIRGWRKLEHLTLNSRFIDDSAIDSISRMPWLKHLVLFETEVSDAGLQRLATVQGLKTLRIHTRIISDEGFSVLRELPNLTDVAVNGGKLTDAALDATTGLKLETISVSATLGGNGLAALAKQSAATEFRMVNYGPVEVNLGPLQSWSKLKVVFIEQGQLTGEGLKNLSPENMRELQLMQCELTDEHGAQLATLVNLEKLIIASSKLSSDFVAHVSKLKKLKELRLVNCQLTDASLAHLNDLPDLKMLGLATNNLTGDGLRHISGSPQLEELDLQNNAITNANLDHIVKLASLRGLNLDLTKITNAGITKLSLLPKLTALTIARNFLTEACCEDLAKLTELKQLNVAGAPFSDAALPKLKTLTKLQLLGLTGSGISNDCIPHLAAFPELRALYADTTRLNDKGSKAARQQYPQLEVWRNAQNPDYF